MKKNLNLDSPVCVGFFTNLMVKYAWKGALFVYQFKFAVDALSMSYYFSISRFAVGKYVEEEEKIIMSLFYQKIRIFAIENYEIWWFVYISALNSRLAIFLSSSLLYLFKCTAN